MFRASSNRDSTSSIEAPQALSSPKSPAIPSGPTQRSQPEKQYYVREDSQGGLSTDESVNVESRYLEDHGIEVIEDQAHPPLEYQPDYIVQLEVAAHTFASRQTKFAELREQALLLRDQVSYHREHHSRLRQFVMESMQNAMRSFSGLSNASLAEFVSVRQFHHGEMQKDHERLMEHESKLHHLETTLGSVEYQMQQEEGKLAHQAESTKTAIENLEIREGPKVLPITEDGENTLAGRTEVEGQDPLLIDYYDKLGEAKIINDRRIDFESDFSISRADLIFDEEHERPVKMSVEQLDESARRERSQFEQDLNRAMAVADEARAACVNAGLNPDAYKLDLPDHFEEETFILLDDLVPVVQDYPDPYKNSQSGAREFQSPPPLTGPFDPPAVAQLTSNTRPDPHLGMSDDRMRQWIEQSALYEQQPRRVEPDYSLTLDSEHRPTVELKLSMFSAGHRGSGLRPRSI